MQTAESVLILTEGDKFVLFEYGKDCLLGLPRETNIDEADSGSSILTMARHVVSKISSEFKVHYLQTKDEKIENQEFNSSKQPTFVGMDNLYDLWMNINYNLWCDELCNFDYRIEEQKERKQSSDAEGNNCNSSTHKISYFFKTIQDFTSFSAHMTSLSVKVHLLSREEINSSKQIDPVTQKLFSNPDRLTALLSPMEYTQKVLFIINNINHGDHMIESLSKGIPRMPTRALYHGIYRQNNQLWITYNSTDLSEELPSSQVLQSTNVIILPGSSASSYDNIPWIHRYKEWLKNAYQDHPELKFLGICFGEQIFAEALGGKCGQILERKQNPDFYNVKIDPIHFSEEFYELPYVKPLNLKKQTYYISKAHGDVVEELNQQIFQVFGSSDKYKIEVLGDKLNTGDATAASRVLGIQGHPEYHGKWAMHKNSHFYSMVSKKPLSTCLQKAEEHYRTNPQDNWEVFREIAKSFITYKNQL